MSFAHKGKDFVLAKRKLPSLHQPGIHAIALSIFIAYTTGAGHLGISDTGVIIPEGQLFRRNDRIMRLAEFSLVGRSGSPDILGCVSFQYGPLSFTLLGRLSA